MTRLAGLITLLLIPSAALAATEIQNRRIERNQTLSVALKTVGLSPQEADQAIGALSSVFDPRKSRDEDALRIVKVDGALAFIDYRQGPTDEYQLRREGEKWIASKRAATVEKKIGLVDFTVDSSLYEAAVAAKEDPVIAMALADVLAWDVDFYQDVRKGDHVRAVVEKYLHKGRLLHYGEVLAANYQGQAVGQKRVFRYQLESGDWSYFQENGASARKSFLKSPLKYAHITSKFGARFHPILQYVKNHNGVDYGTPVGTPVWAVADGTVTRAGSSPAEGHMVCLRHMNGFETCYLHLSRFGAGMRVGAHVSQKQVIAYSGNTGRSTGPHLHYALKRNGGFINPLNQKFPRTEPVPSDELEEYKEEIAPLVMQLDGTTPAAAAPAVAASTSTPTPALSVRPPDDAGIQVPDSR